MAKDTKKDLELDDKDAAGSRAERHGRTRRGRT